MFLNWNRLKFLGHFFVFIRVAKKSSLDKVVWDKVKKLKWKLRDRTGYSILYLGYDVSITNIGHDLYDVRLNGQVQIGKVSLKQAKAHGIMVLSKEIKNELVS